MGYDQGIANRLRAQGLKVVEVAGWQTRGSSYFNPKGFVWHHTAGPTKGNAPSLNICTYGRAGLAGPLCNVFQARDNTIYVVAAGRANHAGTGSWKGVSGNSNVYGIEIENTGYNSGSRSEPWRPDQLDTAAKVAAALLGNPSMSCMHKEWTSRKIDMHTVDGNDLRARTGRVGQASPSPAPDPHDPEEDDEMGIYLQASDGDRAIYHFYGERYRQLSGAAYQRRKFIGGDKVKLEQRTGLEIYKFMVDFNFIRDDSIA